MSRPPSARDLSLSQITDVHIHVQPWRELKPAALAVMWRGKEVDRDRMIQVMEDPRALLEVMDRAGVWRAGLVNYPSRHTPARSEEHTSELQSLAYLVCRLLLEKKKQA